MANKWDKRFMDLAELVATWSSCIREGRQVGAVIAKDKTVMTLGYNGAPAGVKSCAERGFCLRTKLNIPSGTHSETCYAVHAEQNAILQAAKEGLSIKGCTLYCTHQPCSMCARIIINAGIKEIVYKYGYPDDFSLEILKEAGIKLRKFEEIKQN